MAIETRPRRWRSRSGLRVVSGSWAARWICWSSTMPAMSSTSRTEGTHQTRGRPRFPGCANAWNPRSRRDRVLLLERQGDGAIALRREISGVRHFHDLASLLRRDEYRAVEGDRLDEVDGLRLHRALVDVADRLAGHGGERQHHALAHRVQHDVAMGVVDEQGALGAVELDGGRREVRVARWQSPARTDGERGPVVHGHHDPLAIREAVCLL